MSLYEHERLVLGLAEIMMLPLSVATAASKHKHAAVFYVRDFSLFECSFL